MTICAAVLCQHGDQQAVLTISDRMFTSGDIEYESGLTKMYWFSNKIVGLGAGHRDFHFAVAMDAHRTILVDKIDSVAGVAEIYAERFVAFRRRRAELRYLAPLGLDAETFLSKHRGVNDELVSSLAVRMIDETLGVQTIVAGVDTDGSPHIYTVGVEVGEICQEIPHDGRGFMAVGTGQRQFETLLMSLGYTRAHWGSLAAALVMFSAKRKAEVSPGVGRTTDAAIISSDVTGIFTPEAIAALDGYDRELQESAQKARAAVLAKMIVDPVFNKTDSPPPPGLPAIT